MRCPYCKYLDTKVIDGSAENDIRKRRRECLSCHKRFNTVEATSRAVADTHLKHEIERGCMRLVRKAMEEALSAEGGGS